MLFRFNDNQVSQIRTLAPDCDISAGGATFYWLTGVQPADSVATLQGFVKPGGRLIEIATGTGVGTCWLLDGMDAAATLTTVDTDPKVQAIARAHLGHCRIESGLQIHLCAEIVCSQKSFGHLFDTSHARPAPAARRARR